MVRRVNDDRDPEFPADFDPEGSTLSPGNAAHAAAPDPIGPVDRDEQLGEAIEAYLEQAESGVPPDPETFAAGYPELGTDLLDALEGLALVKGLVGSPSGPGHRLEEGRRVAGYRIVRELGRGGMGIVYEAVHVGLDRPVALKVLGSQAAPDSSGRRRFLNEARTAAGLHHTHIVPVFDVGQVGGLCYYAMQRIEGSGLDRVLRVLRRDRTVASGSTQGSTLKPGKGATPPGPRSPGDPTGPLAPSLGDETLSWAGEGDNLSGTGSRGGRWRVDGDADNGPVFAPPRGSSYYRWVADVGQQAAEALAHAHQRGIIHRDIKPSNLLVDARGVIWVADFGLARRLADPSQTQVDSLLGTPRYMSPEQARTGAIDGRADVYSLGATLYELITLRPPFDGQTAAELIDQIASREPSRPRKFDPRVPLDLETILLKALAKRPSDRYAGAHELADDLARFLAHEPVKARRIGPVGRTWRFARRHPGVSIVSVLASSLVLTTATVAYVRVVDARNRADEQAQRTNEANRGLKTANAHLETAVLKGLENQAAFIQLSSAPNRRAVGLDLVREAANQARQMAPDQALRVRLRDQALAFLTLRDVVPRPVITTANGPRHGLVFGPNSQRIAALTSDGKLEIWDAARQTVVDGSRQPIAPVRRDPTNGFNRGPGNSRVVVAGERIAVAGDQMIVVQPDGAGVRWFDLAMPDEPRSELPIKGQRIASVLSTQNGKRFVTVGRSSDADPGREADPRPADRPGAEPPTPRPRDQPDSRFALNDLRISLWDRERPDGPRATLTIPPPRTENLFRPQANLLLAIAPDGARIAAAWMLSDPEVLLWDGDGQPLDSISLPRTATALTLGPAGMLAVAGTGSDVALWDLSEIRPQPMPELHLHQSGVNLLRFDPRSGSMLAVAGQGGGVELWDLSTHALIDTLATTRSPDDLTFAPDGRSLAVGQSGAAGLAGSIALWSVVEPTAQFVLPESGNVSTALAFGAGDVLAIASREASAAAPLQLWGGPGQCPPSIVSWPGHRAPWVAFDASGRLVLPDGDTLHWFQPPGQEPVAAVMIPEFRPERHGDSPTFPPLSPPTRLMARTATGDALFLVRASDNYLWRASAPDQLLSLEPEPGKRGDQVPLFFGRRSSLALAPGGTMLYQVDPGKETLIARKLDTRLIHRPEWSVAVPQISVISLSPDGATLAVGSQSGKIQLRNAADGSLRDSLEDPSDAKLPVESLTFSPDNQILAVGRREQVRLWAVTTDPHPLVQLPGYRGAVRNLAFDSQGGRLAYADEKIIKVWDLAKLRAELGKLGLNW